MKYTKPELVTVGTADSMVLGFDSSPELDHPASTNDTKPLGGVALGLDD